MVDDNMNVEGTVREISEKKPDLVEYRLDKVSNSAIVEKLARKHPFPIIATDRSSREIRKILLDAGRAGFDIVDIDVASRRLEENVREMRSSGPEVIVSSHNFSGTPSTKDLEKALNVANRAGADICKVVTTARQSSDNLAVLTFLEENSRNTRLVSFAMGALGVPSRVLSPLFGAEFAYASLDDSLRTADGQLTIDELRTAWQLLGVR